ncbi:hypothetical protein [Endozoicomonas sp. ONNA1]|uniref:hypothetical protein n=1 Tax=Endozoicomonas sp. ONNA1 TaxID=2828740 RepID=UPI0021490B90|nr:hypothetical protein [Endozoicomonas sp. ONNA1]
MKTLPNKTTPNLTVEYFEIRCVVDNVIYPVDTTIASEEVDSKYIFQNRPQGGGFFIRFSDGSVSYLTRAAAKQFLGVA